MATRLPSGSYRSQVLIGKDEKGKRIYKSFVADTANQADLLALQFKAKNMTTERARKTFLSASGDFLRANSKTLSVTTLDGYEGIRKQLSLKHKAFCAKSLYDIDRDCLQRLLNAVACDHSPKTVRNYKGFIYEVLRVNGIEPPPCQLPQRQKPVLNIPDEEVMKKVFEAMKGTRLEVPVMLAALVPMRRGEIAAARIEDLDENNVLHIHRSLAVGRHGVVVEKSPKNYSSDRYVKLPDELANKIREQGYICDIPIKSMSSMFGRALKRAGIESFRFHDLRHAFVSIAHAAGIPDAYIMSRGGWSTNYTVNNVYKHVLDSDRLKMEKEVNDTMSKLL